ncbi:MAG: UDP-N-acetylmuramoyl-tripeptide--D-alanyl-D-alanine ligase [Acutalibacteraceae bacterium]
MQNVTVNDILNATGGILLCGDKNTVIENISIDSRKMKGNDIFVPFIGEKTDGHLYINSAFNNGAAASFSSKKDVPLDDAHPIILVEDTEKALKATGKWYRQNRVTVPLIGVTGSVGKTSTREIIATALSAEKTVFSTKGNYNGQLGVPMTVSDITSNDDIAVIEMGVSLFNEMEVISQIACVNCAVVTNIGICHIENFLTQENIRTEKLKIIDNMPDGGTLILNGDDKLLREYKTNRNVHIVYYGTSDDCTYRAENIKVACDETSFDVTIKDKSYHVTLNVPGRHNVMNALSALAVCDFAGVDIDKAIQKLGEYKGFSRRMERINCKDYTIIDDAYNASPDSVRAAIDVFSEMKTNGKKIIILADMLELGKDEERLHKDIGTYLADKDITAAVLIGKLSQNTAQGASASQTMQVVHFDDNTAAYEYLKANVNSGDAMLFKGSHSMKLEEIIDKFR